MATPLKIKVTIAGRVYPLTIKDEKEEEGMRKAANQINQMVLKFEKNYAVSDKQDVLAMCALQFASLIEINAIEKAADIEAASEKLNKIAALIDAQIE